jgi:hypothetical protein
MSRFAIVLEVTRRQAIAVVLGYGGELRPRPLPAAPRAPDLLSHVLGLEAHADEARREALEDRERLQQA